MLFCLSSGLYLQSLGCSDIQLLEWVLNLQLGAKIAHTMARVCIFRKSAKRAPHRTGNLHQRLPERKHKWLMMFCFVFKQDKNCTRCFINDSTVVTQKVGENQGKALSSSPHAICVPGYRLTLSQAPSTLLFNSVTNRDAIHKAKRRGGTAGNCPCGPALTTIL